MRYEEAPVETPSSEAFFEWMRGEPITSFSFKVTMISGIELGLTMLWLRLLLFGVAGVPLLG